VGRPATSRRWDGVAHAGPDRHAVRHVGAQHRPAHPADTGGRRGGAQQLLTPNMGLTTWTGDRIRKSDVVIAKNYLTEPEITGLNRLTTMFLDFAEDRPASPDDPDDGVGRSDRPVPRVQREKPTGRTRRGRRTGGPSHLDRDRESTCRFRAGR